MSSSLRLYEQNINLFKKTFDGVGRQYAFVRIPKTGSQTIQSLIKSSWPHLKATVAQETVNIADWNTAFKFAFVRNPWDHLVSWFFFAIKEGSFKDWVKLGCPYENELFDHPSQPENIFSQLEWIANENDKILVNFVGRLENIEEDIKSIGKKIDIEIEDIPKLNTTNHKHYTEYYDKECIDLVYEMCKKDIDTFEYTFKYPECC